MKLNVGKISKFIVALAGTLVVLGKGLADGHLSTQEAADVGIAALTAITVYVVPNVDGSIAQQIVARLEELLRLLRPTELIPYQGYIDPQYAADLGHRLEHGQSRRGYGWVKQDPDHRDLLLGSTPAKYAGAYVDLTAQFPDPPYDQGQLGSCTGNGVAAAVDFARAKQGMTPLHPPSRLFIYYCERDLEGTVGEDSGATIRDGFKAINKWGAPAESDYPYDIKKFTQKPSAKAYADAQLDEAVKYLAVSSSQIFDTIASGYPVVFGFNVPQDFEGDEIANTGSMPASSWTGPYIGGHCVVVVSTPKTVNGVQCVKVRNSWGTAWGDGGYFWMPVSFLTGRQCSDFWMVATMSDQTPTPAPPPFPGPTPAPTPTPGQLVLAPPAEVLALVQSRAAKRKPPQTPEAYAEHALEQYLK